MAQFAVFVEGFVFGDDEAAEIGRFAASAHLPIDDMCAAWLGLGLGLGLGLVAASAQLPIDDMCAATPEIPHMCTPSPHPVPAPRIDIDMCTPRSRTPVPAPRSRGPAHLPAQ